jgi:transcription antitermination factor NusG
VLLDDDNKIRCFDDDELKLVKRTPTKSKKSPSNNIKVGDDVYVNYGNWNGTSGIVDHIDHNRQIPENSWVTIKTYNNNLIGASMKCIELDDKI